MSYQQNRKWADQHLDWAKRILKSNAGELMTVTIAPESKDRKQATDLILRFEGGDIAFRVRRASCKFRDLTLRSRYDNHTYTELHKIKNGFGDWYLYAWANAAGGISEWILVNLDKLRNSELWLHHDEISNGDGTWFIAIGIDELRKADCLTAEHLKQQASLF